MPTILSTDFSIIDIEIKKAALLLRAIKHPLRQKMMHYIHGQGEVNVTTLHKKFKLEQSVASQHLAILRRTGFVVTDRRGKEIFYSINYKRLDQIQGLVSKMVNL